MGIRDTPIYRWMVYSMGKIHLFPWIWWLGVARVDLGKLLFSKLSHSTSIHQVDSSSRWERGSPLTFFKGKGCFSRKELWAVWKKSRNVHGKSWLRTAFPLDSEITNQVFGALLFFGNPMVTLRDLNNLSFPTVKTILHHKSSHQSPFWLVKINVT